MLTTGCINPCIHLNVSSHGLPPRTQCPSRDQRYSTVAPVLQYLLLAKGTVAGGMYLLLLLPEQCKHRKKARAENATSSLQQRFETRLRNCSMESQVPEMKERNWSVNTNFLIHPRSPIFKMTASLSWIKLDGASEVAGNSLYREPKQDLRGWTLASGLPGYMQLPTSGGCGHIASRGRYFL